MLSVGALAPDFEADASDGGKVRLSALRGSPVVLYFFPRAFTPICTRQAARFRDNHAELTELGAKVVGVSPDPQQTQCEFGRSQRVQFPLLADPERRICEAFGVVWSLVPRVRRITFVIGETGRVELVLNHELQISRHLDGVLQHLRKRATAAGASRS